MGVKRKHGRRIKSQKREQPLETSFEKNTTPCAILIRHDLSLKAQLLTAKEINNLYFIESGHATHQKGDWQKRCNHFFSLRSSRLRAFAVRFLGLSKSLFVLSLSKHCKQGPSTGSQRTAFLLRKNNKLKRKRTQNPEQRLQPNSPPVSCQRLSTCGRISYSGRTASRLIRAGSIEIGSHTPRALPDSKATTLEAPVYGAFRAFFQKPAESILIRHAAIPSRHSITPPIFCVVHRRVCHAQ